MATTESSSSVQSLASEGFINASMETKNDCCNKSNDIQHEELELLMMSVIRMQIKSSIPGVIDGGMTIPFQVSVRKTWEEVFRENNVQMNPELHQIRAYGQNIENLKSIVFDYFMKFKTNRSTYYVTIILRPIPKPKIKKRRRKSSKKVQQKSSVTKTKITSTGTRSVKPNSKAIPITIRTRSRVQQQQSSTNGIGNIKINCQKNYEVSPKPKRPKRQRHASKSSEDQRKQKVISNFGCMSKPVPKPTSSSHYNNAATFSMTTTMNQQPSAARFLSFRDESTMAGDILGPDEMELKPKVMQYFNDHCSNRDMLNIRTELLELKRLKKFQALNRLTPFMAGLMQNAFIDDNN